MNPWPNARPIACNISQQQINQDGLAERVSEFIVHNFCWGGSLGGRPLGTHVFFPLASSFYLLHAFPPLLSPAVDRGGDRIWRSDFQSPQQDRGETGLRGRE